MTVMSDASVDPVDEGILMHDGGSDEHCACMNFGDHAPLEPSAPPAYPNERVAISLARDFIAQKEVCPITQDQIVGNKVAVTLCNCVFQANCLVEWAAKHSTCPACRTDLTFRIVTV